MNDQRGLVTEIGGLDGELVITYLGPIGLGGGRYRLTARQRMDGKQVTMTVSLATLVMLDGALVAEIKRAETGAARPT